MKRTVMTLAVGLICATLASANTEVQTRVTAQGPTREKAIQNGLHLAVSKVQGVAVFTGITNVAVQTGSLDVARDPTTGSKTISLDAVDVRSAGTLTLTESQGMVKTFEVVEEQQVQEDLYQVTMDVWVYDYHSPEDPSKIRLAVMPMEVKAGPCIFGDRHVPGSRVSEQMTQFLAGALAHNEGFTVLDRDSTEAIIRERQILDNPEVSPKERVRLGKDLGADYILTGTIPQAELLVQEVNNPALGAKTRRFDARVQVEYRLIVGPTRQVRMGSEVRIRLEDNEVKALAEQWRAQRIDWSELQANLIRMAARQVAAEVAADLNPIRVAAVIGEGQQVILNQGGSRFVPGGTYELFNVGEAILDPQTQAEIGRQETPLGKIRITKVLPRICYAEVLGNNQEEIGIGAVCRPVKEPKDKAWGQGTRESDIQKTSSGGVKLPFD
jgi:curli biogenesis system outer membrane secretion channel CsgG